MKTHSVRLIELEKQYGPAELGKDRPENTISVLRVPASRGNALLGTPGIRPDAKFYLHFAKPVDLTSLVKPDVQNLRKTLTQPPECISGLSEYASVVSRTSSAMPKQPLEHHEPQKDIFSRPKVDQIGYDLPQNGQVHPVIAGHLPVKTGDSSNRRPRESTSALLEGALQTMPTLEAHELLFEREIGACRRHTGRQPLAKPFSSSPPRGPEIDR
jgi:hypothetical protein